MNTPTLNRTLVALAQVLHRLESGGKPVDPEQYRSVIQHLVTELQAHAGEPGVETVLNAAPCVAEVYENLHYAHAGLCRSPLEAAVQAERQALAAITKARRPAEAA